MFTATWEVPNAASLFLKGTAFSVTSIRDASRFKSVKDAETAVLEALKGMSAAHYSVPPGAGFVIYPHLVPPIAPDVSAVLI